MTAASAGGAAYLGFVFYPPSPRAVTPQRAARLCAAIPPGIARVGLFVDADDRAIEAALAAAPIDILQFHGGESPQRVTAAKRRFGRRVMKAVAIAGLEDVLRAARYEEIADILLLNHAKETNAAVPTEPVVFLKATSSLCGPFDDIIIPKNSEKTDSEVELAVVIEKKASYVDELMP